MAVGFIVVAAYKLGRKVIKNTLTLILFLSSMVITYFFTQAFIYPLVLILGGFIYTLFSKKKGLWHKIDVSPSWRYFFIFASLAFGLIFLNIIIDNRILFLFERFYRFGYLVIGGGQVVIPYMVTELVEVHQYMTIDEFLTGFGLVQGIPGPMFSFSAYAGGMTSRDLSTFGQIIGALISSLGIFLPGTLLSILFGNN